MTKEDISKIKKASRGSKFGPWSGDFESEMWKKSALRRLIKRLPISTDMDQRIDFDESEIETVDINPEPTRPVEPDTPNKLIEAMAEQPEPKKEI